MIIELDSERDQRALMSKALSPAHYLGALSDDHEHLTLVTIDPDDPWKAFRAMRRRLRRAPDHVELSLYDAPTPVDHAAEIVVLHRRSAS